MEISSIRGLADMEMMEDPTFLQWHLSTIDDPAAVLKHHPFYYQDFNSETSMDQTSEAQFVSYPNILSFVDSTYINQSGLVKAKDEMVCPKIDRTNPPNMIHQRTLEIGNQNYVFMACEDAKKVVARPKLSQPQDHIIAERKRREKLSQRFIALSALVPALQKMDKASILGGAIKYLKQLQEKVMALEEEKNKKKNMQSVVIVKKCQLLNDAEHSSSESGDPFDEALPEIEARFCERNVLIRVHCEKTKGVVEKTINEVEKIHLKVTNSSAMAFGSCAIDITILAQVISVTITCNKILLNNIISAICRWIWNFALQ
ncbi:PREDICTED: transcription factor bHLH93-like isoform X1 [Lupinus angustifolius]|uniref:transcription factor bHLH93-like isoform X1 n=1 Tax=Lupinus angustifolius TaxID=3871 RepID=UPI00092EF426|nr:PREDICTED: transcription factor bHLH93-like isoform X1 [Lupinus angustifolius]